MKGIRTLVLQDLPYVLPSKNLQKSLVPNYQFSSQLHTSTSSRRFWNFFDFSAKEEPCRDAKKCPSSKDVTSTLYSSNELESVPKSSHSNAFTTTVTLNPRTYGSQFDLKSTPMSCLRIHRPLKQDNLLSLLDGNPVPKTLKWKLKGYKTLRNEQAGDFAFVPGERSYDFDILSRNEYSDLIESSNCMTKVIPPKRDLCSRTGCSGGTGKKDMLCLTAKAIENKADTECIQKLKTNNTNIVQIEAAKRKPSVPSSSNVEVVDKPVTMFTEKGPETPKLLASSTLKRENIKYLPISKSELSTVQMKCNTQPSAQFSSRSSKKMSKPPVPVSKEHAERRSDINAKKEASSMESYEKWQDSKSQEKKPYDSKPSQSKFSEVREKNTSEWSSMEDTENVKSVPQAKPQVKVRAEQEDSMNVSRFSEEMPQSEPMKDTFPKESLHKESSVSSAKAVDKRQYDQPSSTYFAPRTSKQGYKSMSNRESHEAEDRATYESIIGISERPKPALNITKPNQDQHVVTSPCAATQARMQQNTGSRGPQNLQMKPSGGHGSSMSGNSGGGSRKPPASYPPFTTQRSASNSSCLLRKLPVLRTTDGGRRRLLNSKNSSSNISTSTANPTRKCRDNDDSKRTKCKKDSKTCKRYCCPSLQTPTHCDYTKFQCPNGKGKPITNSHMELYEIKKDTTCLPNDEHVTEPAQEICTNPARRRRDDRSCKRDRKCPRERRDRSCDREQQRCPRDQQRCQRDQQRCQRDQQRCQRRRSCPREERQDSCQRERGGREICTKPRRREPCKRQRKCDDRDCGRRSANSTGRRNYTQSAYVDEPKTIKNVKRYSSVPAIAIPLIGMRTSGEQTKPKLFNSLSVCKFSKTPQFLKKCKTDDKSQRPKCKTTGKSDSSDKCARPSAKCKLTGKSESTDKCQRPSSKCKLTGKSDAKKEDPCKKVRETSDAKKEDICKKLKAARDAGRKEDPCKKARATSETKKKEDPCKKARPTCEIKSKITTDPCKKVRPSSGTKKEDPCKKTRPSCGTKKEDPCKKVSKSSSTTSTKGGPCKTSDKLNCSSTKKEDSSGKGKNKLEDSCSKKRQQMCQERKKQSHSEEESAADRAERERKEMEECKKKFKDKKGEKKVMTGLERVISPCKQQQAKDKDSSSSKFALIDFPFSGFMNMSTASTKQDKLPNISSDRLYSTVRRSDSDEFDKEKLPPEPERNFWSFNDDAFEELPVHIEVEDQDETMRDNFSSGSNWFLSWFNACQY
ncbi:PREDICTED: serine/arginine repetitive matrix protein 1-like [Eufriesea mexicana]|uniref:serine/arginine repetitive matrix protein 1-like n=1 Tax=Eufriesea mexicana TaxID=516756 RepID=UPI00083BACB6|nr:PREDICTED: serine/arginine repetitive matrix protein 1-like [Eufriesea mexicana]